jgi:hypothetical protein
VAEIGKIQQKIERILSTYRYDKMSSLPSFGEERAGEVVQSAGKTGGGGVCKEKLWGGGGARPNIDKKGPRCVRVV